MPRAVWKPRPTPVNADPLRPRNTGCDSPSLEGHVVKTAREQGWTALLNGELLRVAEQAGFDVPLTTDKNIAYQQSLRGRKIALVALGKGNWPVVRPMLPQIVAAVNAAKPGSYTLVDMPDE